MSTVANHRHSLENICIVCAVVCPPTALLGVEVLRSYSCTGQQTEPTEHICTAWCLTTVRWDFLHNVAQSKGWLERWSNRVYIFATPLDWITGSKNRILCIDPILRSILPFCTLKYGTEVAYPHPSLLKTKRETTLKLQKFVSEVEVPMEPIAGDDIIKDGTLKTK